MLNTKIITTNEHTGQYVLQAEDATFDFIEVADNLPVQLVIEKELVVTAPINILQSGRGDVHVIAGGKGVTIRNNAKSPGRDKAFCLLQTRDFISKKSNAKWLVVGGV